MARFIGLCQDSSITEIERRMVNRYVIACQEASSARGTPSYERWHHLAHLRYKALQKVRHML